MATKPQRENHNINDSPELNELFYRLGQYMNATSINNMSTDFTLDVGPEMVTFKVKLKEVKRLPKIIEGETI